MHRQEYERDLLLVGGGHTHVLVLKLWAMKPLTGVRITLVSDEYDAPYSGMLPGFVAGHYSADQTSIDLNALCKKVGARWIQGRVTGMRPLDNCVEVHGQPNLHYDCVSIDTGAQPSLGISWEPERATCVKPISQFHRQWHELQASMLEKNRTNIGVIGAGVGGVELCLALAHKLGAAKDNAGEHLNTVHLIFRGARILPGLPQRAAKLAAKKLAEFGVKLHPEFNVAKVSSDSVSSLAGQEVHLDHSFICTAASAPSWLKETDLALSDNGFIDVNQCLRSNSHGNVFAAGDVADVKGMPRPKAGVYAVRQAPFLADNLRRFFQQQELKPVSLQTDFLKLISLGDQSALAVKYGMALSSGLLWRWKDKIDRDFIDQFNDITTDTMAVTDNKVEMHCSGCGSKLGPQLLQQNLTQLPASANSSLNAAVHTVEDATVWQPAAGTDVVQSIDGFRSFTDDHYQFGQIAVQHAFNDLLAMGAEPVHAQAWVNLAFHHPRIQQRDHLRLMQGVSAAIIENGAILAGGHSTEGAEDHLGIVANGALSNGAQWSKTGAQNGDVLVMSKSLGTGIVLAADAQCDAPSTAVQETMEQMQRSNLPFFEALKNISPHAVTDVSGFGLLGHLLEMLDQQPLMCELQLNNVPVIAGARPLAALGYRSTLRPSLEHYLQRCDFIESADKVLLELILDPQTSGGLLAAVSAEDAEILMRSATSSLPLAIIGRITMASPSGGAIALL